MENPEGFLGTVRNATFAVGAQLGLVGDAAQGITPFFGQGTNGGFEGAAVSLKNKYNIV